MHAIDGKYLVTFFTLDFDVEMYQHFIAFVNYNRICSL